MQRGDRLLSQRASRREASEESGSGDCFRKRSEAVSPGSDRSAQIQKSEGQSSENTNAARSIGSCGIALRLMHLVNVPRAPSLELYVLPNGGGQLMPLISQFATKCESLCMELRGIEPLTSAVRLQRSPN